jgi:beta-glucosidase
MEYSEDAHIKLLWSVPGRDREREALEAAEQAEAVILVMGLSPRLEGEEMDVPVEGFSGGDRLALELPSIQERLIRRIQALGKPTVLVLLSGSALAVNWASEHVLAIVEAWYPGQAAGQAIADVLFGDYNPAGRLPVTFYKSVAQLPDFKDYGMPGRTYRYFKGEPLYPFGHGLSYSRFGYSRLEVPKVVRPDQELVVSVDVQNRGEMAGEEVVQLYLRDVEASAPVAIRSLKGFERIFLEPGEKKTVKFILAPKDLSLIDRENQRVVEPGLFEVTVGGKQPGFKGMADAAATECLTARFEVKGELYKIE